jgi:hypothetical protein
MALAATVITLVIGVATMFREDKEGRKDESTKLMRMRIIFQAIALVVMALLLFTSKHS